MKKLAKSELIPLLNHWARRYRVLAPSRSAGGDCLLEPFDESSFTLNYGKPAMPPKSVCFPQSETIFAVEGGEYREVIAANAKKTLLFGIRSCDLMGIRQASSFMTRERRDPYFSAKRDALVTVVMACGGPQNETCFCTTMQSGPFARAGFDLQFYDAGAFFIVEAGSGKGQEALSTFPLDEPAGGGVAETVETLRQQSAGVIERREAVPEAMSRLRDRTVDDEIWDRFGRKCIQCGGCAYVCPTCTCFNVCDCQTAPGKGVRRRSWDACLFGGYTREASGHNPRTTQALRIKRRHEHKLLDYHETDIRNGLSGCTGCGRCSDFCPVHIGTLEIAAAIAAADHK